MDEQKRLAIEQLERVSKNLAAIGETVDYTELAIEALEQDTVPFDFELYQAGLMEPPKGVIEMLDKIRAEIRHFMFDMNPSSSESDYACNYILDIINKYQDNTESEEKQ